MLNYRQSIANDLLQKRQLNIISEIPDRMKCTICSNVIANARQSPCGCRYCCHCITDYLNANFKFCPGNSIECKEEELIIDNNVLNDFGTDREIRLLKVRCQNDGCEFVGELRLVDDHLQNCRYGNESCELCGQSMQRMNIDEHMFEKCENRLVKCHFCGVDIVYRLMEAEHLNIDSQLLCAQYKCECPLKCNATGPIIFGKHRLVCSNRPRDCPFSVVGCPASGFSKSKLNNHIKDHIFDHSRILFEALNQYKTDLEKLNSSVKQLEQLNGFVWKIDNFSNLLSSEKNRFFSPEFSIGQCGYRFMLKMVVVIGDGGGESVQLYFIIVKGDFDDVLRWPFDKNVTVSILDQQGTDKHYSKLLRTNLNPENFRKPNGESRGCGWERFIDFNMLKESENWLRNDRLFIKCTVHV